MADVVIAGAGPAGWALASACARSGLETVVVAPEPAQPWRGTYGLWRDELPELPDEAIAAAPGRSLAIGTSRHWLDREYLVVHNDGLRRWLGSPDTVRGRVIGAEEGCVVLADGRRLPARVAVNATGGRPRSPHTEQTAYGLTLPASEAERLVPPDTALFMDWTPVRPREPSFLYAVPVGGGRVLIEETCLARKPGLPLDVLAARLRHRLAKAGISPEGPEELVRIPLDLPRARALAFGSAAGLIHPATGYSLAASLRLAPAVAEAIREGLRGGAVTAVQAARRVIWPPSALAVHALRQYGRHALLSMPSRALPEFFDLFFQLPVPLQRAFTSGRTDVKGTAAAMATLFRRAPWRLRAHLAW
jgi:lycopene beta-cyclase